MDSEDPTPRLCRFDSYAQALREFHPVIPSRFNIANAIFQRRTDAVTRIALTDVKGGGDNAYTFGGLDFLSDKFATALSEAGINQGDSVAVMLPQSAAAAVAHFGVLKAGAVVVPLPTASEPAWLEHALVNSNSKALVAHESAFGIVESLASNLTDLVQIFVASDLRFDPMGSNHKDFWSEINRASSDFIAVDTAAAAPAFIFYPASQGRAIGVVHSHGSLVGQLAAFEMCNNLEIDADSVFWTPNQWCSVEALFGMLLPAWWHGCSVVGTELKNQDEGGRLTERWGVTNILAPGAQLEALRLTESRPRVIVTGSSFDFRARNEIASEVTINQAYGTPETGWFAGGCARWFEPAAGSAGRIVPGRLIEIVDNRGNVLRIGETGRVAVHRADAALFAGYHGAAGMTETTFDGEWFLSGNNGYRTEDCDLFIAPSS